MPLYVVSLIFCYLTCACGDSQRTKTTRKNKNSDESTEVSKLEKIEQIAQREKNYPLKAQTRLKINYLRERSSLTTPKDLENLDRKYSILESILELETNQWKKEIRQRSLLRGSKEKDPSFTSYPGPDFSSVYHPLVLKEVNRVYNDFGHLYIKETKSQTGEATVEEVQVKKPWSGYWYPFTNKSLYDNKGKSPLEKFDALMVEHGRESTSAVEEKKRRQSLNPASWEGLCDAWSLASISIPEPLEKKVVDGITFFPSDLKALYTFSHLKYPYEQYGITYRGDADTDGTYQDIKPEAFHKIIVSTLSKRKKALIVDDMAGIQIWNKPLYRYRWKVTQDPELDCAFLVKAYPWLIKERSKESNLKTNTRDTIAPIYNYRLYVDKSVSKEEGFLVIAGQWIKESYRDHPDTVKVPLDSRSLGSHNREFNKNLDLFEKLLIPQES